MALRTLAPLSALAATAWLLVGVSTDSALYPFACTGLFVLPTLAAWLTLRAVAGLPASWLGRVAFWTAALAGWMSVLLLAQARHEAADLDERHGLMLALSGALLGAGWVARKARVFPTWRMLGEAAAGGAVLALAGGVFARIYDARTHAFFAQAEARWAEIGLPMAEFEKSLAPAQENAGSDVIRAVLREQIGSRFYKEGTAAADREPAVVRAPPTDELITRAAEITSAKLPPGDDLDLSRLPIAALEPHAAALDDAYRRILAAEPPVWACDPADGYGISVPNFLGLRKFAQLASADAMRRGAAGDDEGAARAIAAGLRVGERLRQHPALVSLMIGVTVDAFFAPKQARLPAADGFASIARDAAEQRAAFLRVMRWEGWIYLRCADRIAADRDWLMPSAIPGLPRWAQQFTRRPYVARQCAILALHYAEHTAIWQSPAAAALPDFGAALCEVASAKPPGSPIITNGNFTRCVMRINATLLLREQAALIRDTRARLAAGQPVESRPSVVLPHLRWALIADPVKNTVATRLVDAPKWIVDGDITGRGDDFWLLPLDGHLAWQFHAPAHTAAAPPAF